MLPLESACIDLGIQAVCKYGAPNNPAFENCDGWTVTLRFQRRQMTVPFYQGFGHHGAEPTAHGVLECLLSDASGVESSDTFEDWCRGYGLDPDSRRAEQDYRSCGRISKRLRVFLGPEFDRLSKLEH